MQAADKNTYAAAWRIWVESALMGNEMPFSVDDGGKIT